MTVRQELDLSKLARQLNLIAEELRRGELVASNRLPPTPRPSHPSHHEPGPAHRLRASDPVADINDIKQVRLIYAEFAREAYATRRRRGAIFGNPELFGEPAWDILLDLYIAHVEKKSVSVSSACIGSAAPPTTGLRWLGVLTEEGLILREHDPEDQRRVLVRLTDRGLEAMDEYFASAGQSA